jgi:hypothetical protein
MSTSGTQRQIEINIPLSASVGSTSVSLIYVPIVRLPYSEKDKIRHFVTGDSLAGATKSFMFFSSTNSTSGTIYKVPSGKNLKMLVAYNGSTFLLGAGLVQFGSILFGYTDTPNSTTTYNQVAPGGSISYFAPSSTSFSLTNNPFIIYDMTIPQNMYPFVKSDYTGNASVYIKLIGLEE